ncbi:PASTA domain-containing protein [Amycolatopsis minnesotensis]|uniref:PASTA domain-containing protein n=1 Tax=Amycolatopsis minnesotensis TaxID=337894 RepID=A0ABN2SCX4_9PSEU
MLAVTGACTAQAPAPPQAEVTVTVAGPPSTRNVARASAAPVSKPQLIEVPDVAGMNHQQAQDTIQAAGLHNLREVDGKGLGRPLLVDRDWVQAGQDPPAGAKVAADTTITLTATMYSDH